MPASAVTQLTGQIPVMTMAAFTGNFAKHMFSGTPRSRMPSRGRARRRGYRSRRSGYPYGSSPI